MAGSGTMKQSLVHVAVVVADYDEAIAFYTEKLGFELLEDIYIPEQDKRWVLVAPTGGDGAADSGGGRNLGATLRKAILR